MLVETIISSHWFWSHHGSFFVSEEIHSNTTFSCGLFLYIETLSKLEMYLRPTFILVNFAGHSVVYYMTISFLLYKNKWDVQYSLNSL